LHPAVSMASLDRLGKAVKAMQCPYLPKQEPHQVGINRGGQGVNGQACTASTHQMRQQRRRRRQRRPRSRLPKRLQTNLQHIALPLWPCNSIPLPISKEPVPHSRACIFLKIIGYSQTLMYSVKLSVQKISIAG
jgi:hypothetical protein